MGRFDSKGTVVNRKEIYITSRNERFLRKIRYAAKDQKFFAELPHEDAIALNREHSEGATMADAIKAWEADLEAAKAIKTSKKKVLIVEYVARTRIGKKSIPPAKNPRSYSYYDREEVDEHENKLELSCKIADEHTIGKRKEYYEPTIEKGETEPKQIRVNDDDVVVEWTPEREAFFVDTIGKFKLLIERVSVFMRAGEGKILAEIESKSSNLIAYNKEVSK